MVAAFCSAMEDLQAEHQHHDDDHRQDHHHRASIFPDGSIYQDPRTLYHVAVSLLAPPHWQFEGVLSVSRSRHQVVRSMITHSHGFLPNTKASVQKVIRVLRG